MTIQGPPGNNSNHPEPIRGNGSASRAHQVPFTTPLPVDHLLETLFKYLMRCGRSARAVRILPHGLGVCIWMHLLNGTGNSLRDGRPPE